MLQNDTWAWNGTVWSLISTVGPAPRFGSVMVYDAARDRTVLFGGEGQTTFGDTWEWDGVSWRLVPGAGPAPRAFHTMAYDSARERVILHGGFDMNQAVLSDTWELGPRGWQRVTVNGPQTGQGAMVYDVAQGVAVQFGGGPYPILSQDTWLLAPTVAGSVTPLGVGCGGPGGIPSLTTEGPAILGNRQFAFRLGDVPAGATVFFALSVQRGVGQALGPCVIEPALPWQALVVSVAGAAGDVRIPAPLPRRSAFAGLMLFAQGGEVRLGLPLLGAASLSPGSQVTIGT